MLTTNVEETTGRISTGPSSSSNATDKAAGLGKGRSRLARALSIEWLGQTVASICWIVSMLTYGISSAGDWLQLMAASAWLLANIASIAKTESA